MYKATILYRQPADREAFDAHYWQVHVPLAAKMAGLRRWTITKVDAEPAEEAPYYLIVELYADDRESLMNSFNSAEGKAAAADVRAFVGEDVVFLFGEEEQVRFSSDGLA